MPQSVPHVSLPALLLVSGAFLIAGIVKGLVGMGLPTTATGLITLAMTPGQAAALLVLPNFITNIWQAFAGGHLRPLLRRLWALLIGICVGSAPGASFLAHDDSGGTAIALGALLVVYAVLVLASWRLKVPPTAEWWLAPLVGAVSGLLSVLTGIFMLPLVPYLNALSLSRDELIQALGLSFLVSAIALTVALLREGALPLWTALASLLTLAPAGLGMLIGQWLRHRTPAAMFVRIFAVGMLAIGLQLVIRHLPLEKLF